MMQQVHIFASKKCSVPKNFAVALEVTVAG